MRISVKSHDIGQHALLETYRGESSGFLTFIASDVPWDVSSAE